MNTNRLTNSMQQVPSAQTKQQPQVSSKIMKMKFMQKDLPVPTNKPANSLPNNRGFQAQNSDRQFAKQFSTQPQEDVGGVSTDDQTRKGSTDNILLQKGMINSSGNGIVKNGSEFQTSLNPHQRFFNINGIQNESDSSEDEGNYQLQLTSFQSKIQNTKRSFGGPKPAVDQQPKQKPVEKQQSSQSQFGSKKRFFNQSERTQGSDYNQNRNNLQKKNRFE